VTRETRFRIAIDGRNLLLSEGTGVATYGRTLLESLGRLDVEAELVLDPAYAPIGLPAARWRRPVRLRRYARALLLGLTRRPLYTADLEVVPGSALLQRFARLRVARDAFRTANVHLDLFDRLLTLAGEDPPTVMHWTYPMPLRFRGAFNIYTVHDLIPLRDPELTNIDLPGFRRLIACVAEHADHIVTVSESSRRDIIDLLGCPPEKVTNTYQALELPPDAWQVDRAQVDADVATALGLPFGGYLLYAGTIEPRKNVRALIEAHRESGVGLPLVLGGPEGWRAREQLEPANGRLAQAPWRGELPPPGTVLRLPYVPYETLLNVIRGARALVFPSLSEGFGLPVLEAMALGTPVITSNAGAAAMLVDVRDRRALADAIRAIAGDAQRSAELTARGRRRAAQFSLAAYTERLGRFYRELTAGAAR
jgi:glycosyltransferase involved in cell wall biosynthesis